MSEGYSACVMSGVEDYLLRAGYLCLGASHRYRIMGAKLAIRCLWQLSDHKIARASKKQARKIGRRAFSELPDHGNFRDKLQIHQ